VTQKQVTYGLTAEVTFDIAEGVDLTHWPDPDTGEKQHRMTGIYPDIVTEDQMLAHLAYNAIFNSVQDASRLDGWADLERGQITMRVDGRIEP
jgi:hypothetical protein